MNTLEALTTRRSCRSYLPDPVPADLIDQILEAGTFAPTGMGRQSPIIVAITNKEVRDELSRLNAAVMGGEDDPFYGAPAVLVVLARKDVGTHVYDGSLVMGNMLNAAHELGLGSCWAGWAEAAAISGDPGILEVLNLPPGRIVTGAIVVGIPRYRHRRIPARRPLAVSWGD